MDDAGVGSNSPGGGSPSGGDPPSGGSSGGLRQRKRGKREGLAAALHAEGTPGSVLGFDEVAGDALSDDDAPVDAEMAYDTQLQNRQWLRPPGLTPPDSPGLGVEEADLEAAQRVPVPDSSDEEGAHKEPEPPVISSAPPEGQPLQAPVPMLAAAASNARLGPPTRGPARKRRTTSHATELEASGVCGSELGFDDAEDDGASMSDDVSFVFDTQLQDRQRRYPPGLSPPQSPGLGVEDDDLETAQRVPLPDSSDEEGAHKEPEPPLIASARPMGAPR